MQENVTLLLSIHKNHADNIFSGVKKVELRKSTPKIEGGDRVLMYISSPVKAMLGFFIVHKVVQDSPKKIWTKFGKKTGLSKKEFNCYYGLRSHACAIIIQEAKRFTEKITLENLRDLEPNFQPPQCYKYLNNKDTLLMSINERNDIYNVVGDQKE